VYYDACVLLVDWFIILFVVNPSGITPPLTIHSQKKGKREEKQKER